jgi:hypothetical protein
MQPDTAVLGNLQPHKKFTVIKLLTLFTRSVHFTSFRFDKHEGKTPSAVFFSYFLFHETQVLPRHCIVIVDHVFTQDFAWTHIRAQHV